MKIYNPTSAGRRGMTTVDYSVLDKVKPTKRLLKRIHEKAGRNNQGKITVRHQGGGRKRRYRMVDFKQDKMGVEGRILSIEYDPYRTAFIACVLYKDGDRRYIMAPQGLAKGDKVITGENVPPEVGMRTALVKIPVGTFVHNVELSPRKGGQLGRAAGTALQVMAHEEGYTHLKMPSGEVRKVLSLGYASIGAVSNPEHSLTVIGKAGRSRWLGIRPTVRGSAMNPVDHPYGGGEGRTQRGLRKPKTKWGKVTGGRKTRKKSKKSNKLILIKRQK